MISKRRNLNLMPSLLLTNANRVINKLDDLHLITLHYQIDIIAITETWLTGNIVNSAVALPNFTIFRRDRKHGIGGGVMCYTADFIWTRVLDLAASNEDDFEIFWVLLRPRLLPRPLSALYYQLCTAHHSTVPRNVRLCPIISSNALISCLGSMQIRVFYL